MGKPLEVHVHNSRVKFVVNNTVPGPDWKPNYDEVGKLDLESGKYSPENLLILVQAYSPIATATYYLAQAKIPVASLPF